MTTDPARPRLEAFKALLLDFDHTLTDFGDHVHWPEARPVLRALYAEAGVPESFLEAHAGSIGLYTAVAALQPLEAPAHFAVQRRAAAILDELERGGVETTRALPGARELLEGLDRLGVRAAIVTSNSGGVVYAILQRLGLWGHVDVVIGRSEVARLKPDPEGILAGCRLLGVAPSGAAYLGDSVADIEAARAAGLQALAVTTGLSTADDLRTAGADAVFATLLEVLEALEELEARERLQRDRPGPAPSNTQNR